MRSTAEKAKEPRISRITQMGFDVIRAIREIRGSFFGQGFWEAS